MDGHGGWPGHLIGLLEAIPGYKAAELPHRYAVGGHTTALMQANIDAELASRTGTPNIAFIHLGANDVGGVQAGTITEAAWKANMSYVVAAIHAKWASTEIYVCPSYRYSATDEYDPGHALLWDWMNDLIALTPTYLFAGWDSKPIFENNPELLGDGLHPNHDGCVAIAAAAQTVLGY